MAAEDQEDRLSFPLSLDEKKRFVLSALPRMAEHTFPYLCSVIGIHDAKTGQHLGSGIRCVLRGRRAVLTAMHVIQQAAQEPRGSAISAGYGRPPFVVHGPVNIDPLADLAVYFVPADYPHDDAVPFWPSARIERDRTQLATDYLFLHGFPGARPHSYSSQLLGGVLSRSLPYGAMQRTDNLPSDLEPFQFAVEYDPDGMTSPTGLPAEAVDPHGLSGSPVWRIGASGRSTRDWRPEDSLLVGIVTQWRAEQKVLVATAVSEIPPDWLE